MTKIIGMITWNKYQEHTEEFLTSQQGNPILFSLWKRWKSTSPPTTSTTRQIPM